MTLDDCLYALAFVLAITTSKQAKTLITTHFVDCVGHWTDRQADRNGNFCQRVAKCWGMRTICFFLFMKLQPTRGGDSSMFANHRNNRCLVGQYRMLFYATKINNLKNYDPLQILGGKNFKLIWEICLITIEHWCHRFKNRTYKFVCVQTNIDGGRHTSNALRDNYCKRVAALAPKKQVGSH